MKKRYALYVAFLVIKDDEMKYSYIFHLVFNIRNAKKINQKLMKAVTCRGRGKESRSETSLDIPFYTF